MELGKEDLGWQQELGTDKEHWEQHPWPYS